MPADHELVARIRRGDRAAFAMLYDRHKDWVLRVARRHTPTESDALDVLQETFVYLLRKGGDLELRARMTTFLYPVVRNLARSAARKAARFGATTAEVDIAAGAAEAPSELSAALRTLPTDQREVLLMRFVDGMTGPEIAEALGIPEGTVKSRLHHAVGKLREDRRLRAYFET